MVGKIRILADKTPDISEREIQHREKLRRLASRGMVLLENDGTLPFRNDLKRIALFGAGARKTVKGGSGSGDVNVREFTNIEAGLKASGLQITTQAWLDEYDRIYQEAYEKWGSAAALEVDKGADPFSYLMDKSFIQPPVQAVTEQDVKDSGTDTAVYVIARRSGEGKDRHNVPGDYQLSMEEKRDIDFLTAHYEHTVILLNTGGGMDTSYIRNKKGISAVLLIGQAGSAAGDAAADILTGKVCPSGRLTATWAKRYEDYPCSDEFSHNNGDLDDAYYREGIYVGYRYFDTFHVEPAYCFGYGLSYTEFSLEDIQVIGDETNISVSAVVRNIGKYMGRECVQVYYSAPEGKLEKPYQELAGFAMTDMLEPGQIQKINIVFATADMASYSESEGAWILEEGIYYIRIGENSRKTQICGAVFLEGSAVTEEVEAHFLSDIPFTEISKKDIEKSAYQNEESAAAESAENVIRIRGGRIRTKKLKCICEKSRTDRTEENTVTLDDIKCGKRSLDELVCQLTSEELARLCTGNIQSEVSVIGNAGKTVPGSAGETTDSLWESRRIPSAIMADGPAGLRLVKEFYVAPDGKIGGGFDFDLPKSLEDAMRRAMKKPQISEKAETRYQYCSALPTAVLLAQSWDMKLIEECSAVVAEEMRHFGINLWLAPGMNIRKNPLCGRNFEYYSEDPFLTGKCAAASVRGIQKADRQGESGKTGAVIKHLAANNQEDNRNYQNSHIKERALREIYLRGFQICIREAEPAAVMTSYNLLNGTHAANHFPLLTKVVREEWGFQGMIMTDWGTTVDFGGGTHKYPASSPTECIRAGNDLIMPGTKEDQKAIMEAAESGKLPLENLRKCAKNVIMAVSSLA